jgi:hypothetical protein
MRSQIAFARSLRRTPDDLHDAGLEDGVERRGELATAVADQKPHPLELRGHCGVGPG